MISFYVIHLLFFANFACAVHLPIEVCKTYTSLDDDVYIGGIFSLHDDGSGPEEKCGLRLPVSALQLTEAMVFAVNAINQNDTVLPNITLGFRMYDDCSDKNYALWESIALVGAQPDPQDGKSHNMTCKLPGRPRNRTGPPVVAMGFVGTGTYSTEVVLSTATLFNRPVISYGSTSDEPLDEDDDGYYFSTIPSDRQKAQAIVDLLVGLQLKHSSLVVAGNDEAEDFGDKVIDIAAHEGVCILKLGQVEYDEKEQQEQMTRVVKRLRKKQVNVTVLVSSSQSAANAVLSAASTLANVTWIVSNLWDEKSTVENQNAQGGLFIRYHNPELIEFEEHFRSVIRNFSKTSNPWVAEFCDDLKICETWSKRGFSTRIPTLAPVMGAVFAMAYALDKTVKEDCDCEDPLALPDCLMRNPKVDKNLKDNVNDVSFPGTKGAFRFKNRSVLGHFEILNHQWVDGVIKMVDIGSWRSEKGLDINESLIQWSRNSSEIPISRCWTECQPGEVVVPVDSSHHNWPRECCECVSCKDDKWPSNNFTCAELQKTAVSWHDPTVVILVCVSSIGLLLCGLTSYGMIRHRHLALIKATSRELSTVNIIGIVLAFVAVFPLLCQPSPGICGLAKILYVLSFTVMYAPLCLKVNRIYRIFDSSKKSAKPPRFTGSTAQLVIVAVLVAVQLIIISISALVERDTWTSVEDLFYETGEGHEMNKTREVFCKIRGAVGVIATVCYDVLLLLACCFFAYKARNVPGNFNEARFYVISVYANILPIAAAVPILVYAEKAVIVAISVCLMPICNGYVTLGCVYLPKLYAIIANKTDEGGKDRSLGEPSQMGTSSAHQNLKSFVLSKGSGSKVQPFEISNADGDD